MNKENLIEKSDSDFSPRSSNNYIPNDNEYLSNKESSDYDTVKSKRICHWKKSYPAQWKKNDNKKNRMSGLPYESKGTVRPANKPKPANCNSCKFKCLPNFSDQ